MKQSSRTHVAVVFMVAFFLWSFTGCAAQSTFIERESLRNESKKEDSVSEKADSSERETEGGFVSTPFGKIPLIKKSPRAQNEPKASVPETNAEQSDAESVLKEEKDVQRFEEKKKPAETKAKRTPEKPPGKKAPENENKKDGQGDIVLNFDNADLYEVVRTLGEILQINYIVDPNVRGRVTIHTAGRLSKEELWPVFFQILEANGLTAVKEDSLYKIVRLKEAPQLPLATRFGDDKSDLPPEERIIIQVIPLNYISFQEMTKLLTPFVTAGGAIISHKDSNTLLVVDKASNIEKVLRLIDVFDVDFFEGVQHRFFKLQYVDIKDTTKAVEQFIDSYGLSAKEDFKVIELERINTLLLISKKPKIFRKAEEFIKELDVRIEDDAPRIYVYAVKNGQAAELSNLLNSVFSKGSSDKKKDTLKEVQGQGQDDLERPGAVKPLFQENTSADRKVKATPGERVGPEGSGTLKGEIKITADEIRNSLIIEAIPRDYRIIESILAKIDVLPRQVLIEVTLAEVKLDSSTALGIEWQFDRGDAFISGLQSGATLGSSGLNFQWAIVDQAKQLMATVSALATEDKVDILSSPSVLASDNKEAKINVSTEIPVASAEFVYDGTSDPLTQTNIQYRNTGVILSVTPHINEFGLVSMDVNQEVSEQADSVDVGGGDQRLSFFKRSVNTTLTVRNGQTIVIGGLIRKNQSDGVSGVPCLGQVPVLSYFFGRKEKSLDKTELIIFITPRVIASLEDIDYVSEEFRQRIDYDPENFKRPSVQ